MALVLLPCDLPTWPRVQRYLTELKTAETSEIVVDGMLKLHNLCCISLDSDEDYSPDPNRFSVFQKFLDSVLNDDDKNKFFEIILPAIVESALQLKSLKPPNGIHFSLQQQAEEILLDRKLVRSLLAHAFFSTFPKRTSKTHPTLQNFNFSEYFFHLNSLSQQAKLRSFFRYFEISENEELYDGSIRFNRKVNLDWKSHSLGDPWLLSNHPLCPLVVHHDGLIEDMKSEDVYQMCFSTPRLGGSVLIDGCDQEEITFATSPELLVCLLCVESLENNETLLAHNCVKVGLIQDGRKFSTLENPFTTNDSHICMLDANDYSNKLLSQFEEKNLLKELLKCYLGFCQPKVPRRLSPLGESCGTPPPEMWYSVCGTLENTESVKPQRPTLIGQSFSSFGETKGSNKNLLSPTKRQLVSQESEYQDAVSYPWEKQKSDDNEIWLTPMEHSKNITTEILKAQKTEEVKSSIRLPKKLSNQSADSLLSDEEEYASCEEEENSEPPTPLAQGPVASMSRLTILNQPIPTVKRSSSSQSDSDELVNVDSSLHRASSTGFLLSEDDYFVGDGLEVEQEWLRQFRNRSMSRSVSGISRRNSSRYSFSSDFSSDLDEIYEHFEEMMAKGPVSEDPAVAKYAGGLLKRTLSDSLTAARHGPAGDMMPRSLSLADHATQEKKNQQLGKTMDASGDGIAEKTGKRKLSANLVSIVIEQTLEEVEAKMALASIKGDEKRRQNLQKLYSQISVWWNYNRTYEFSLQLPVNRTGETVREEFDECDTQSVSACDLGSALLRRWFSEPDFRALENNEKPKGFYSPELSKWNAKSNLFQTCFLSPVSSSRYPSGYLKTRSLDSIVTTHNSLFYDQSDSDQLWLVFDSKQSSSEDNLSSLEGEEDSNFRRWIHSSKKNGGDSESSTSASSHLISDNLKQPIGLEVIDEIPQEDAENKSGFNFSNQEGLVIKKDDDISKTARLESKIEIPLSADGIKPVVTGNWGCGRLKGDPQLKAVIQWLAASQAELPYLVYFTQRNQHIVKLDIVNRVVLDRHWSVGTLMKVLLKYCKDKSENAITTSLFDVILPRENY